MASFYILCIFLLLVVFDAVRFECVDVTRDEAESNSSVSDRVSRHRNPQAVGSDDGKLVC